MMRRKTSDQDRWTTWARLINHQGARGGLQQRNYPRHPTRDGMLLGMDSVKNGGPTAVS